MLLLGVVRFMEREPFSIDHMPDLLAKYAALVACPRGRGFVDNEDQPGLRLVPPRLYPIPAEATTAARFLEMLPEGPGLHMLLLIQAGATSMGMWNNETLLCHKVIKKYVKRGKGKAQTTYLKTRGKSRYGSRLRLQNAKSHLLETGDRMLQWWQEHGTPQWIYYSCPTRLWSEVLSSGATPELAREKLVKIGMDVGVPGHEALLKARRFLNWGYLERSPAATN